MRLHLLVGLLLAGPAPVAAQQDLLPGSPMELPTLGSGAADHATVAANHEGDWLIANHADHPSGGKLVEVTVATSRNSGGRFRVTAPILIGDPSLDLLGDDSCRKPDVVALHDGSFAVVFPRTVQQDPQSGRLEIVRILTRDAQGDALSTPIVESPGSGRGYVIDASVVPGEAGVMPDLALLGPTHASACAVVYAHEAEVVETEDLVFREYDLRIARIDFSQPQQSTDFIRGPWLLETGIPMDNEVDSPFAGGIILPDMVLDDADNLVVAWEQYLFAPHQGLPQGAQGRVVMTRYKSLDGAQPLERLDRLELAGQANLRQQRRPALDSNREDQVNGIAITWTDREPLGLLNRVQYQLLEFPNGSMPGVSPPVPAYWVDSPLFGDAYPVTILGEDDGLTVAVRDYGIDRELLASYSTVSGRRTMVEIDMGIQFPWRPATALFTVPARRWWQADTDYVLQVCEGADVREASAYRVHVRIDPIGD
jgi:hypothetical protein